MIDMVETELTFPQKLYKATNVLSTWVMDTAWGIQMFRCEHVFSATKLPHAIQP